MRQWLFLRSDRGPAAYNMALDEAMLTAMPRLGRPILRFYGWTQAAASFGYFQKYAEVERFTLLRPLVRRPTGGGLVPHDADWTYSLAFPTSDEWYSLAAAESYRRIHEWIGSAFGRLGISVELAACCRKAAPGQCFVGHERDDVLWRNQKIGGAAQRRTRSGLLIQGSIQPGDLGVNRAEWEQALCDSGKQEQGADWLAWSLDVSLSDSAAELVRTKYGQAAYNRKR